MLQLIIQNKHSDIVRYLLTLQRNRVEAMQSELSIKASAQDIRDPAKDFHLLRGFAFIANQNLQEETATKHHVLYLPSGSAWENRKT